MKFYFILSLTCIFLCFGYQGKAQTPGALDLTFNGTGSYTFDFGFQDNLNDITLQPDQKSLSTGVAINNLWAGTLKVLRLNTDGTPDNSFATNGVFTYAITNETYGYESKARADGKIVIAGIASTIPGYFDMLLVRVDSNGIVDSTFGTNGSTVCNFTPGDDLVQGMTFQTDGKILVSGTITDSSTAFNIPVIVRFTENGILDSTFGLNGMAIFQAIDIDNELTSIAVQSNGKIVASGHYSKVFTGAMDFDILTVCVDSNGIPDPNFGINGMVKTAINGGIDDSFGMAVDANQNIFVTGFTVLPVTNTLDMVLLKYDSTGTLDSSFGSNGIVTFNNSDEDVAYDIVIQSDNKILLGGSTGLSFFGPRSMAVWRYLPNGVPDSTFGVNGYATTAISPDFQDLNSIALQTDGKIIGGGKVYNGSQNDIAVVRYYGDAEVSVKEISSDNYLSISPNPIAAGKQLTIQGNLGLSNTSKIEVRDITGKLVATYSNLRLSENSLQINISENLKAGIYFVSVMDEQTKSIGKLVVQ